MRVSTMCRCSSCMIIKKESLSVRAAVSRVIECCVLANIELSFVHGPSNRVVITCHYLSLLEF